ncbi:integral peroxisomal membrane peroxin-domain-containing protein [Mycena capillaripes]|nr:integral peroxisomal membrane peroxin-domain-containing protein [Mycena capillaripes]
MLALPLTALLVELAPGIRLVRRALEIPAWTSPYDAFLLIAAWWAAVLLAELTLRYFFPLACLAVLAFSSWSARTRSPPPIASEHTLQAAVADLTTIEGLIPALPALSPSLLAPKLLWRTSLVLYLPYLLITHLVRLRVLVAVAGTVLLAWRAPWAIALRSSLWRSAWFRWAVYHLCATITGEPLPLAPQSALSVAAAAPTPTKSLRFLFTIYENQRWWVGLDWTAALLPAERPSWCSKAQNAVAPPNAFVLPDDTTLYLPSTDGKGRVKRRATWSWEEDEWRVMVRKEGATALSRVEKPLPSEKEENPGLLMKAAVKMRESSSHPAPAPPADDAEADKASPHSDEEEEELITDEDGWVYGDNKWEKPSAKGGMGKYTRFRRWTRVAIVTETVESVPEGEVDVAPQLEPMTPSPISSTQSGSPVEEKPRDSSPLKQRLKSAMHKATTL